MLYVHVRNTSTNSNCVGISKIYTLLNIIANFVTIPENQISLNINCASILNSIKQAIVFVLDRFSGIDRRVLNWIYFNY